MDVQAKIFVSHAAADEPVVKAFVNLLEGGIGVPPENIFCTSIKGQGIRPGAEFKESIRKNLDDATTVIALISENYYHSPYCMCELGGAWLQAKDFIPVLVPPIRFSNMKAVLQGLQALRIDSAEDLDELRDELDSRTGKRPLPTHRWNERRSEFLLDLPGKLRQIPETPTVPREHLEKAKSVISEYEDSMKQALEENGRLQQVIEKLKTVKDAKCVLAVEREQMQAADVFEELVAGVYTRLKEVAPITRQVIFSGYRKEDYYPGSSSSDFGWSDAERPLQYSEVLNNFDGDGLRANKKHPKVKLVLEGLENLDKWLREEASEDFFRWYSAEYEGFHPDLTNRKFWDTHLWDTRPW